MGYNIVARPNKHVCSARDIEDYLIRSVGKIEPYLVVECDDCGQQWYGWKISKIVWGMSKVRPWNRAWVQKRAGGIL